MTEDTTRDEQRPFLTDAGARKLLWVSLVASIVIGFIWGWCLYPTFEDPRIWNVVGLAVIAVVFLVTSVVGVMGWLAARE